MLGRSNSSLRHLPVICNDEIVLLIDAGAKYRNSSCDTFFVMSVKKPRNSWGWAQVETLTVDWLKVKALLQVLVDNHEDS